MTRALREALQHIITGEVTDAQDVRKAYSRDASLFEIEPEGVVYPKDVEDIKALVRFVGERRAFDKNISLTVRSGGTDMTGGPLNESIIVDVNRHLNQLKKVGSDYAVVEPGMFYRDFEKETLKKKLLLPSFPASREICTIGGMVANNSGGEKTLQYGKTIDYVTELKVVLRDGNEYVLKSLTERELKEKIRHDTFEGKLYKDLFTLVREHNDVLKNARPHVTKNSAGYNLWDIWDGERFNMPKLFVGSQGTLGIITEITVRLVPAQPYRSLVVAFFDEMGNLAEIVDELRARKPTSLESFDDKTLRIATKFFFSFLKLMGSKNLFSLAWRFLPEFWMVLRSGVPKLIVLIEFEGKDKAALQERARETAKFLNERGVRTRIAKNEYDARKYWLMRRESFNLLRQRIKGKQTAPFIDDIVVHPKHLSVFLPKLYEILEKHDLLYTIAGHIGDGNFHIIPLMTLDKEKERAKIEPLMNEVYKLTLSFGGSLTGEHNDGLIRTPYLEQMFGKEVHQYFEQTKKLFDPLNIFNPRKKVGGTLAYALKHIKRA